MPGTPVNVPYKYTGQELDTASNLYFYESRYYHAIFGRFIAPDTVVPDPFNPQDLNRYNYARNSPPNYTDPTGFTSCPGMPGGAEKEGASCPPPPGTGSGPVLRLPPVIVSAPPLPPPPSLMPPQPYVHGPFGSGNLGFQQQLANMVSRGEIISALLFSLGINPAGGLGAGPTIGENALRGRAAEARVLKELGLTKNTQKVTTAEGTSIPDALTRTQSIEIKDALSVSLTKQLEIQTTAAREAGRESVLITGAGTRIFGPVERAFDNILRRTDLGPRR